MTELLRINGAEIAITTANTVANSSLVRVYNGAAAGVLSVANSTGGNVVSATIPIQTAVFIRKNPTDTVAGPSMLATPVRST
jgi:hypothetical protein